MKYLGEFYGQNERQVGRREDWRERETYHGDQADSHEVDILWFILSRGSRRH